MFDSVTATAIPDDVVMVAGYIDGKYEWSADDWARFPWAIKVRIACSAATDDGHVLDVEPGNSPGWMAPGWVTMRREAGVIPTVYCSLSDWGELRDRFDQAGVIEPEWWIAAYPGNGPELYEGSIAHQYANPETSGGHFDLSVVADYWPGVDPAPAPPIPPPVPPAMLSTEVRPVGVIVQIYKGAYNVFAVGADGICREWAFVPGQGWTVLGVTVMGGLMAGLDAQLSLDGAQTLPAGDVAGYNAATGALDADVFSLCAIADDGVSVKRATWVGASSAWQVDLLHDAPTA